MNGSSIAALAQPCPASPCSCKWPLRKIVFLMLQWTEEWRIEESWTQYLIFASSPSFQVQRRQGFKKKKGQSVRAHPPAPPAPAPRVSLASISRSGSGRRHLEWQESDIPGDSALLTQHLWILGRGGGEREPLGYSMSKRGPSSPETRHQADLKGRVLDSCLTLAGAGFFLPKGRLCQA